MNAIDQNININANTDIYLKSLIESSRHKTERKPILEIIAKVIRVLTIPPIIISVLLILLFAHNNGVFNSLSELLISVTFFGIVPVLAYPVSHIIPKIREKGRDGQRALAFVFTILGYIFAVIYSLSAPTSNGLKFICVTYLMSALFLVVFNKLLHIKASGHACSTVGPLTLAVYYLGIHALPVSVITALLTAWSSVKLKRHTVSDLFFGAFVCLPGSILSYIIVYVL